MSILALDAEGLYSELLMSVRALFRPGMHLVGVTSGGAWLAERLQRDLNLSEPHGVISSALHRDDYARRGMTAAAQTQIPFDVNNASIILLDDVLFTGRTIRAVINELFDFGRPANSTSSSRMMLALLTSNGICVCAAAVMPRRA